MTNYLNKQTCVKELLLLSLPTKLFNIYIKIKKMKIRDLALLLAIIFIIASCNSTSKEFGITDSVTKEIIVGYSNSKYVIGETKKIEIKDLNNLEAKGLRLLFDEDEKLISAEITNKNYQTKSGIQIGDSKSKVEKIHGKPLSKEMKISKGEFQIGNTGALFYDEIVFFLDRYNNVNYITLKKLRLFIN